MSQRTKRYLPDGRKVTTQRIEPRYRSRGTLGIYATTGFTNLKLRQNRLLGMMERVRVGPKSLRNAK